MLRLERFANGLEALDLVAGGVEIRSFEPTLEGLAEAGPLTIDHREPGGISIAAFDEHVLAEETFVGKAVAQGGTFGGLVFVMALPLKAPVAEFIKHVFGEQIQGFRGHGRALEEGRIKDVAHFNDAVGGLDAHESKRAEDLFSRREEGEELGVHGGVAWRDGGPELLKGRIGTGGEIAPKRFGFGAMGEAIQIGGVFRGGIGDQLNGPAGDCLSQVREHDSE